MQYQLAMRTVVFGIIALLTPVALADPTPVAVGAGSYASEPPAHEGENPQNMLSRTLYIVGTNGRPIPTNDWWTDLIVSPYAGDLWAYPLVVSAGAEGARVNYPTTFNADGSHMELGPRLTIGAQVDPPASVENEVFADFEAATYPAGWTTTGTAFGSGPAFGTLPGQSAVSGYVGDRLVNSFLPGDQSTGTLTTPAFTVTRRYVHFLIAGGAHPGETEVRLLIDGASAFTATGDNSETLEWHTWDLGEAAIGQSAQIEIVDTATGGWGHICADQFVFSDSPLNPGAFLNADFEPVDARALDWSDWMVSFRMAEDATHYYDVTTAHGMPFTWVECVNVEPRLTCSASAAYSDDAGAPVTQFPYVGTRLAVTASGRTFGLHAPAGTTFDLAGNVLAVRFAGSDTYLAVSALAEPTDLATLDDYARAIPRQTRFDWSFEPEQGRVRTTWSVEAEPLDGGTAAVVQGWLPHHYRRTNNDLAFAGWEYTTPRGRLRMAVGNTFTIDFPWYGLLPNVPPAVADASLEHPYDPGRMALYLAMYAGVTTYGGDTYWGGKDLVRLGRYMTFAAETGADAEFDRLRSTLRGALEDWLTFSPEETEHYFAAYPGWGALVGFDESYYSYEFTDHHFHYGYFTMASALLGMYDAEFLASYGPMIRLVAKEYANWDRDDASFPFLRTFDPWGGHSYAGGLSSPGGNNQESSSEAMQSWAGLFLLGNVLDDDEMAAAGAMGYAIESVAVQEYWRDYYGYLGEESNFPPAYEKTITGILFDNGQAYATYFSGDPAWIYGIQWLPLSPALNYLGVDPQFARSQYETMMAERDAFPDVDPNTISQMGTSLGNVVLGYAQYFDPAWVAEKLDELYAADDPIATDNYTGGLTYYFTHANRRLGAVRDDVHMSLPTGQAFHHAATGVDHFVVYNPAPEHRLASVYVNDVLAGCMIAPASRLTESTALVTPGGAFAVLATWPSDGEQSAPADATSLALVVSHPVNESTLGGATISGPGVASLALTGVADELLVRFTWDGALQRGAEYEVTIPATVESQDGAALGTAYHFTFTVRSAAADERPDLVAHWRLDEQDGNVARDASGADLDGVILGDPTLGVAGAALDTESAFEFDGDGDEIELGRPSSLATLTNNFTISTWIKPSVLGGNRVVFGARWHDYNGWSLRIVGDRPAIERLGTTQLYNSDHPLSVNAWTHLAATFSADNNVTFYVNGQPVASIEGDQPAAVATEPWFIGGNNTGDSFAGAIDDVQVYRRALDASEIGFLYANPGRTISALAADFDQDGDVDLDDYAAFAVCHTSPAGTPQAGCVTADLDADDDVDLADFAIFQAAFTGQ